MTSADLDPGLADFDSSPDNQGGIRRTAIALSALVAASVIWVAHFSSRSFFFWDDFLYLRQAQIQGLSLRYLFERYPFNGHASPGHRFGDWLSQALAPLNFVFAQALLLVFVAGAVVLLFGVLTELAGPGRLRWFLSALYATSTVQVAMVASWGNGLLRLTATCLSLGCIYGYLRHRRTGSSRWMTGSWVFLAGSLLFYEKPLLVPVYLLLLRILVLEPGQRVRAGLAQIVGRERRVWGRYVVVAGIYTVVFAFWYYQPSPAPSAGALLDYLGVSWSQGFLPSVAGIYVPASGVSGAHAALLPWLDVAFFAVVAWSLVRDRRAWRAWAFFAIAFLLNAIVVGLPLLRGLGLTIGYRLSYAMEATYLLPIAVVLAFRRRPAPPGPSVPDRRRRAEVAIGAWMAAGALIAHLVLAWSAAGATVADTTGPQTAAYIHRVEGGLRAVERNGTRPTIIDGSVPDYVVSSYLLYGVPLPYNRYSELFRLVNPGLSFGSRGGSLYRVGPDGTLHPVPVTPGGAPARLSDAFSRPDSPAGLGSVPAGPPWQALAGTWGIANRQAYLSAPIADGGLAVVALGQPLASAQVRVVAMVAGAGLVFAYQDPGNYWVVQAEPSYGTWNVVQVQEGNRHSLGNIGEVSAASGTVVSATISGNQVAIAIDGRMVRTLTRPSPVAGLGAGIMASGPDATGARFTDFAVATGGD
ncbi:MAG: hypothetical protein M3Y36_01115 [Actinomycetota bacterium]|nr:hypothetical protein [Actinomycetota bacterium]